MNMRKVRALVALVVFLSIVVGLVVHTGTGTPSALGWRDIAAICPVGALEVLAGAQAFLVHPLVLLAVVLVAAFFLGKAFCSWVCPVPHISRFFRSKKDKAKADALAGGELSEADDSLASTAEAKPLPDVGGERDGRRLDSRHFVLLGSVVSSFAFGFPVFCLICPVGLSFAITIGVWNLFRFNEASWGLIVFPLLVIAEVVIFRRWCHTFCPISALLSLVAGKGRVLRPVVDRQTCLRGKGADCRACVSVCPEKVDPHSPSIPECSTCVECVEACPVNAIRVQLFASKKEVVIDGISGEESNEPIGESDD